MSTICVDCMLQVLHIQRRYLKMNCLHTQRFLKIFLNCCDTTNAGDILLGGFARTRYVDEAYCYRPTSVVCRSVCMLVSPAEAAEPIEMLFGLRTRVDLGNHVLDGVHIPRWKAILRGGASHCKV